MHYEKIRNKKEASLQGRSPSRGPLFGTRPCINIIFHNFLGAKCNSISLKVHYPLVSTNERSEMRTNESAPLSAPPWIGQAAYNDVDWVLSGVMETRDRWRVADNPISFDSDYMVFVSPPPVKVSKASAPIRPFNIYVSPEDQLGQGRALSLSLLFRCGVSSSPPFSSSVWAS